MDHPSRAGYPEGWDTLATLFRFWPLLRTKRFRGHRCPLRRKENSPRGVGWLLRGPSRRRQLRERCGNVNPLPFRCREQTFLDEPRLPGTRPIAPSSKLIYNLGSIDPRSIAVLVEPFSTSTLRHFSLVFATTTKICTKGRYAPGHPKSFLTTFTFTYS